MESRPCKQCGKLMHPRIGGRKNDWKRRTFCDLKCKSYWGKKQTAVKKANILSAEKCREKDRVIFNWNLSVLLRLKWVKMNRAIISANLK